MSILTLFSILIFVWLVAMPFVCAYLVVWSVKQIRLPKAEVDIPLPKKPKKAKMSAKEKRTIDILNNIDAYDGTSYGQKTVR